MSNETQNNWDLYSKLVIKELERLNDSMLNLNQEIQYLKKEIVELKVKEDNVKIITKWKDAIDDVTSPSRLKTTINDVEKLKTFKTQAITVWLIAQAIFSFILFILNKKL